MGSVRISVENLNREPIPNYIVNVWLNEVNSQNLVEISTGPSGVITYSFSSSATLWIQPKSDANWVTPVLRQRAGRIPRGPIVSPLEYRGSFFDFPSVWFTTATVKPNKPNITAEFISDPGFIRITHINDTTRYENDTIVYYNTDKNFATATQDSQYNSSHTVAWSNSSAVDPITQISITTVDFSDNVLLEDQQYWFWVVTFNSVGSSPESDPVSAILFSGSYTLNINGATGGIISGPSNCSSVSSGDSVCSVSPSSQLGVPVNITAIADSTYVVGDFIIDPPMLFTVQETDSQNHTITVINYDQLELSVTVNFESAPCLLNLLIDRESFTNEHGQIKLNVPDLSDDYSFGSKFIGIPNATANSPIIVYARPNRNYQVKSFVVDGVERQVSGGSPDGSVILPTAGSRDAGVSVAIAGLLNQTVAVRFEEYVCPAADQVTLNIDTSGVGSVFPISGDTFCIGDVVTIQAVPANGWAFLSWTFPAGSNFSLDGNNLIVAMTGDVLSGISANFVEVSATESIQDQTSTMFYCPSENYKNNIVSFDFTNSNEDPSIDNNYHFRVNFYNDADKSKLVYSAFSLADNKRWFSNDGSFSQLSTNGLNVGLSETVSIIYDPEALPQQITETQKPHLINDKTVIYEKPLAYGIKYYVEIQAYELSTNTLTNVATIPLTLDCNRVDSFYWNYNKDKNNWLCSGQGKTDLRVCGGFGQAINSSIDSNLFGIFKLVWQGRRISNIGNDVVPTNNIYSALWDSGKDILYSSGQGLYDVLELQEANHPVVITDPALNFYISGTIMDEIKYKTCGLSCQTDDDVVPPETLAFGSGFCYPGETSLLSSVYDEIKMRVYEEDISNSLVINDEKVVPVVNKKSIRLDVDGIVGAYAVRVKNMEDPDWGEWINIDNELYPSTNPDTPTPTVPVGDNLNHDAYRIDNNRFLVQWDVERHNGLRRICCQVLTIYGISNTFCIEVLFNFEVAQHVFKFYIRDRRKSGLPDPDFPDDETKGGDEFPQYNGQYILSLENAVDNSEKVLGGKIVYFDAIFSEPVDDTGEIKFNVVQQGINDLRNENFDVITENKFSGKFEIFQNDGIFDKDGAAFIEIVFPGSTSSQSCGSDERDKYNFINADEEEIANIDLLPEEVYQNYQRNRLSKALDINKFRQNYDKDDTNFKFGNPGYYRK